jgi:hypothetical protein
LEIEIPHPQHYPPQGLRERLNCEI